MVMQITDVMRELAISRDAAKALSRRSDFPTIRISERKWVVREADFAQWLADQVKK